MNPEEVAIAEATASLTELYKASDSLMTKSDNVDEMKVLVTRVNSAYDCLTSLCSNLSNADLVPGTSITKLDFDSEYWEFKLKVQQWFDKMQTGIIEPSHTNIQASIPPTSSPSFLSSHSHKNSPVGLNAAVSKPGANVIGSSSDTNDLKVRAPPGLDRAPAPWSSLSQTFASSDLCKPKDSQTKFLSTSEYSTDPWKTASIETEHVLPAILLGPSSSRQDSKLSVPSEVEKMFSSSHRRQQNLPHLQPDTNLASASQGKQSVSIPNAKSQTSSKRSKHSGTSSIASSASRLEEAKMELELARFQRVQNQERMKEEEEMRRQEAEMRRQEAEMRRQEAEMRRKEEEMRRYKTIAEDERRIKAAEFKAALLEARNKISSSSSDKHSYHDVTQSYMKNVNIPQKSSVPTVPKIFDRADSSPLRSKVYYSCAEPTRLEKNINDRRSTQPNPFSAHSADEIETKVYESYLPSNLTESAPPINREANQLRSNKEENYYRLQDNSDQLLPKPTIKLFEGDPLDYWAFYNRFRCHVGDWLSPKRKFSYLLQHCSAEVANNIQHFEDLHHGEYAYDLAWNELKRRYGQPYVIAQACEERLSSFPKLDRDLADRLNKLSILMKRCCHALADDKVASSLDSVPFLTNIANKFTIDLKRKWIKTAVKITNTSGYVASFKDLTLFVEEQARIANSTFALKLFGSSSSKSDLPRSSQSRNGPSKASKAVTFQTFAKTERKVDYACSTTKCQCCAENHKLFQCSKFRSFSIHDRWQIVRKHKLCKRCLNPSHEAQNCPLQINCKKRYCDNRSNHNSLLHATSGASPENLSKGNSTTSKSQECSSGDKLQEAKSLATLSKLTQSSKVYLDIVPVKVKSDTGFILTYALLDSGSDRTFCERRLAKELKLNDAPVKLAVQTLMPGIPCVLNTKTVNLSLSSLNDNYVMDLSEVVVVDSIPVAPSHIPGSSNLQKHSHLRDISLPVIEGGTVTLLIGNDFATAHRCLDNRFSPEPDKSPDAVLTPFGWTLRGSSIVEENDSLKRTSSNFFVRGLEWPTDAQELEDLIVSDEGEFFPISPKPSLGDIEDFLKFLQEHKEISEFGSKYSMEDPMAFEIMCRQLQYVNGHYELPLLWKNSAAILPDSYPMTVRRLQSLKRRLIKDPDLHRRYTDQMESNIKMGHAEKVPLQELSSGIKQWYIPHQPVVNPKKPEKVRIVYDCAAASSYGKSLNDFLMKGPDLMNSLVGVLLRFRREKIAIVAEIETMFYQIRVNPTDRDALRFLWWSQGNLNVEPSIYRMTVHLFGAKSSPSCASFCLRQTAKEFGKYYDPQISEIVFKNFYVDDCLISVESEQRAVEVVHDLRALLLKGGFNLRKWLSTSDVVMQTIPENKKSKSVKNAMPSTALKECVLGIDWCVSSDEFFFNVKVPSSSATKRQILAVTNSLYDPLGFVLPVVLRARLIYSEVCRAKLDWDEPLLGSHLRQWESWVKNLTNLDCIKIPRCFNNLMNGNFQMQLHVFADASNVARGAVCYVRMICRDIIVCRLVMAKSHIAGSGQTTIPRLELEAALDAVKLSRLIRQELNLQSAPCFFWTDSTIVLQSLRADTKKFSTFPRNRLQRILKYTKVYDWSFVGSKINPADKLTRGMSAKSLANDEVWFEGPRFLYSSPDNWPVLPFKEPPSDVLEQYDLKEVSSFLVTSCTNISADIQSGKPFSFASFIERFSDLYKLKLSTAWLERFKRYISSRSFKTSEIPRQSPISVLELENAELDLVRYVQSQEFASEIATIKRGKQLRQKSSLYQLNPIVVEGVLRVGGRLDNVNFKFDLRHPIILPQCNHLTFLIIDYTHSKLVGHSGVNATLCELSQKFWIVHAKVAVRKVLNNCVVCRKCNARSEQQYMSDLPAARLQIHEPPFSHVGTDYFGPLVVKVKRSECKRYGCLFTCLTTRAIHLELSYDLTSSAFINALRRFLARRGPAKCIYSDNGTNFVGAERILSDSFLNNKSPDVSNYLRQQGTSWSFNPPNASHMGGIWERMIRTVRKVLLAITPKATLTDDDLHTLLAEVESIVNSRPLADITLEAGAVTYPLTPNHLLRLNPAMAPPPVATDEYSRQRFRIVQFAADQFWKMWVAEYLKTIRLRGKWHQKRRNLQPGDIVLIQDILTPRGQWPLGKITKVFPDKSGMVRSVMLKSRGNLIKRPITKLCLLLSATENEKETD